MRKRTVIKAIDRLSSSTVINLKASWSIKWYMDWIDFCFAFCVNYWMANVPKLQYYGRTFMNWQNDFLHFKNDLHWNELQIFFHSSDSWNRKRKTLWWFCELNKQLPRFPLFHLCLHCQHILSACANAAVASGGRICGPMMVQKSYCGMCMVLARMNVANVWMNALQ